MSIRSQHLQGVLITFLGVLILTPDALILRLIEANTATLIFWRGLFQCFAITGFYMAVYRSRAPKKIRAMGWTGVIVACLYAGSNIFFITSIRLTSVANTLVIVAASPLIAAFLSWFFLREPVPLRTWLAAVAGFAGVASIFVSELGGGSMTGNLLAAGAACTLGCTFVVIRRGKVASMVPAVGLTGLIIASLTAGFVGSFAVSPTDLMWLILIGGIITPISFGLITLGPRYLQAPEVNLIMLVETILGPFWVWLVLGEAVPQATWIGGAILVGALVLHSAAALRCSRAGQTL